MLEVMWSRGNDVFVLSCKLPDVFTSPLFKITVWITFKCKSIIYY